MRRFAIPRPMLILMLVTAALITATGVTFGQTFINILPLYVSLCVGLLQSRVSRTAYLIGACNSLLYAVVYAHFKLYASAAYAVLFSSTIQFATYFRWKSRPQGQSTLFRAMTNRQRLLVAGLFGLCWGAAWLILSRADSGYRILDISTSLLGILISLLTMLAYFEYAPLMILSGTVNIVLFAAMLRDHPAQITYLIYALYSMVCQIGALKRVLRLYKEQTHEKEKLS